MKIKDEISITDNFPPYQRLRELSIECDIAFPVDSDRFIKDLQKFLDAWK